MEDQAPYTSGKQPRNLVAAATKVVESLGFVVTAERQDDVSAGIEARWTTPRGLTYRFRYTWFDTGRPGFCSLDIPLNLREGKFYRVFDYMRVWREREIRLLLRSALWGEQQPIDEAGVPRLPARPEGEQAAGCLPAQPAPSTAYALLRHPSEVEVATRPAQAQPTFPAMPPAAP